MLFEIKMETLCARHLRESFVMEILRVKPAETIQEDNMMEEIKVTQVNNWSITNNIVSIHD